LLIATLYREMMSFETRNTCLPNLHTKSPCFSMVDLLHCSLIWPPIT
jgi:hypothetical protein